MNILKRFAIAVLVVFGAVFLTAIVLLGAGRTAQAAVWTTEGFAFAPLEFPALDGRTPSSVRFSSWDPDPGPGSMDVNYAHDWVSGSVSPTTMVTIVVADSSGAVKSTSSGPSQGDGSFSTDDWGWDAGHPDIQPGDMVTTTWDAFQRAVNPVGEITGQLDFTHDLITGTLNAPGVDPLNVSCEVWQEGAPGIDAGAVPPNGGAFVCDFNTIPWDLDDTQMIALRYQQVDGDTVINVYNPVHMDVNYSHNWVEGQFSPDADVTLTVADGGGVKSTYTGQADPAGWFNTHGDGWDSGQPDIAPGDMVTATWDGNARSVNPVGSIDATAFDFANDLITGTVSAAGFSDGQVACEIWQDPGAGVYTQAVGTDFFCDFAGVGWDLQDGQVIAVRYFEDDGDSVIHVYDPPLMNLNYGHDWVDVFPGLSTAVMVTVTDGGGGFKASISGATNPAGWFSSGNYTWDPVQPDLMVGDLVTATWPGGSRTVTPIGDVRGEIDLANDVVSGTLNAGWFAPATLTVFCSVAEEGAPYWEIPDVDPDGGPFLCDYGAMGWDLQGNTTVVLGYFEPDGDQVMNALMAPNMIVNYAHNWIEGVYPPYADLFITVTDSGGIKGTLSGQADGSGWLATYDWPWDGGIQPDIRPDDTVTAAWAGGARTVDPVGAINAVPDYDSDHVIGTVDAAWFNSVDVACEIWEDPGVSVWVSGVAGAAGPFDCDFTSVGWDLQEGQMIAFRYFEPDGDSVINVYQLPWMRVNYAHDWVGGDYPVGHTFWITVTDYLDDQKGSALIDSQPSAGWQGDGFETNESHWAGGAPPDIVPGDFVYFQSDDGYTNTLQVGTIDGTVDIDADSVTGTLDVAWWVGAVPELDIECHPWGGWEAGWPADAKSSSAAPDGSSQYSCQWGLPEYDVGPGEEIAVMYVEPDLDRVLNVFRFPAADLGVNKWPANSGEVAPGGTMVFNIQVFNQGEAEATGVVLTDTLPAGSTYIWDSSPYGSPVDLGDRVVWSVGTLAPGEDLTFYAVMENTAAPGEVLTNTVNIFTAIDTNPDNNYAEAQVNVMEALPDLNVNKNPLVHDPAPGETFLYAINYGNSSPVPSGEVFLTDTLPVSTTVAGWWSENGGDLWSLFAVDSEKIVLYAPSLPGFWGDQILLQLAVDPEAPIGTQLTNTVEIWTEGDPNLGDNFHLRDDVWVGEPRLSGYINKNFNWGELVPGGSAEFHFYFQNDGNVATPVWITDTLPADTTFLESVLEQGGWIPFPPDSFGPGTISWFIGVMQPGEWLDIDVRLAIDPGVISGTLIENCAEIAVGGPDSWPFDNVSCASETVQDPGPNLRVSKDYQWNWDGQLSYWIRVENIGTTSVQNGTVTDTIPLMTTFNGEWWHDYWDELTIDQPSSGVVTWSFPDLPPGSQFGIGINVDLDGGLIGELGHAFTNSVEVTIPDGDNNPLDNAYQVTSHYGAMVHCGFPAGSSIALGDVTITIPPGGPGDLACVEVIPYGTSHPAATGGLLTGAYWKISGWDAEGMPADAFSVRLTIRAPFPPDVNDKLCRYTGFGWDCAASSFDIVEGTITRAGVTQFSDWAAGDDVGPTAVGLAGFTARSAVHSVTGLALAGLLLALGWWLSRRRKQGYGRA